MTTKILASIASKTEESEFYTPIPKGYKIGKTKYVVTFGTVLSGLGKGIFSSSLGMLLKLKGIKVAPIKMEGYLNIDSGTLNPYRHGEVFVLDDGTETDMDLGTYERFLDQNLSKVNFTTNGQIFTKVLERERKGGYLGRDVQFVPHVTGEIKLLLRDLALKSNADAVLIEIGGTVGDIENSHYIEAIRQLAYEEGKQNVCFVVLTYILKPTSLGEQKSKAAQLGIRKLMELGIQPDFVACRAESEVTEKVKEKISIYTNVPVDHIISLHDLPSVYLIPSMLKESKIDYKVVSQLNLKADPKLQSSELKKWDLIVEGIRKPTKKLTIGITGKYTSLRDSYASIIATLEHCGAATNAKIEIKWIDTEAIEKGKKNVEDELKPVKGIIVPGGFGKRGAEGKIACIKYVRENNIPYLGLCYGFQMAVVEFARNVCGIKDANTTELIEDCKEPVIDILPEQKEIECLGGNMRLGSFPAVLKKGSLVYKLYGKDKVDERHRHRYEVNNKYLGQLESKGMIFSGTSPKSNLMEFLELNNHKYFVGTQGHPEFKSRPMEPAPLFLGFIKTCLGERLK